MRGAAVKRRQQQLGIDADGQFASGEYQQKNGLVADGALGPGTLAHMELCKETAPETIKAAEVPVAAATHAAAASGAPRRVAAGTAGGRRRIWDTIKSTF